MRCSIPDEEALLTIAYGPYELCAATEGNCAGVLWGSPGRA